MPLIILICAFFWVVFIICSSRVYIVFWHKYGVLQFLDESLACLELLVEERLALSSLITEEAREVVVVPVSDESVSDPVEEESLPEPPPSSLLVHEIMVRPKKDTNKMCKILSTFYLH